jgi:hypothetical protein
MTPFEKLYGRRCRTPLLWNKVGELKFLDLRYPKMPRGKFIWQERTCGLRNQDRRVMSTIGEEN